jgi:hypothetical protein
VIGNVKHSVFLHCLDDGLKVALARRHVFQNDAVFDALTIGQGIADIEGVIESGAETILADVLLSAKLYWRCAKLWQRLEKK